MYVSWWRTLASFRIWCGWQVCRATHKLAITLWPSREEGVCFLQDLVRLAGPLLEPRYPG